MDSTPQRSAQGPSSYLMAYRYETISEALENEPGLRGLAVFAAILIGTILLTLLLNAL